MATRLQQRFEQDNLGYTENTEVLYKMPRDRPYRRWTLWTKITITGGGTTAPAGLKTEGWKNLIKKIRLIRNGSDTKIHVSGISKFYMDYYLTGVAPQQSAQPAVGATGDYEYWICYVIDFATYPKNLSDFTALQPVRQLASIHLGITWGDINDIFTTPNGATIKAAGTFVKISMTEAFENSATRSGDDIGLAAFLEGALDFRVLEESPLIINKKYDSFGLNELPKTQEPTPSLKLYELFRTIKNYGSDDWSHSNSVVDYFKLENVQGPGEPIFRDAWLSYWATQKQDYGLDTQPVGILLQNYARLRQGGVRNVRVDSLRNKFLAPAPAAGKENAVITASLFLAGAAEDAV